MLNPVSVKLGEVQLDPLVFTWIRVLCKIHFPMKEYFQQKIILRILLISLLAMVPYRESIALPCIVNKTIISGIYNTIKEALIPGLKNGMTYNQCRNFRPDTDSVKICETFAPSYGVNKRFCGSQDNEFFECLCNDLYDR